MDVCVRNCPCVHTFILEVTALVGYPWVSDQGSHFKNEVMLTLQRELHTRHHFTSAYHPQSNGTVEVVCREVIRALRALLSEYQLGYAE